MTCLPKDPTVGDRKVSPTHGVAAEALGVGRNEAGRREHVRTGVQALMARKDPSGQREDRVREL